MCRNELAIIKFCLLALIFCLFVCSNAYAVNVSQCDAALVEDRDNSVTTTRFDYRLATLVTQEEWNKASASGGISAVIYGVPVGANYSEYQDTVTKMLNSRNESISVDQTRQLAISGLSTNGRQAYSDCIKALTHTSGVSLALGSIASDIVTVIVSYIPSPGTHKKKVSLKWIGMRPAPGTNFPKTVLSNGSELASVLRPKTGDSVLSVKSEGTVDQVEIFAPTKPTNPPATYTMSVDTIDDLFYCTMNDDSQHITHVTFGNSDINRELNPYLKPGKNKLSCTVVDIHPDGGGHPCWHYHFSITKNHTAPPIIDRANGTCGQGSQPPGPIVPEYLYE